jgi:hypothetical protein
MLLANDLIFLAKSYDDPQYLADTSGLYPVASEFPLTVYLRESQ